MNPLTSNPFVGIPVPQLQTIQAGYIQALTDIGTGKNYTLNGRTFTAFDLQELKDALAEINIAINAANGSAVNRLQARKC